MSIIRATDFTGEYKIATDVYNSIDTYITKYEKNILLHLLGADLYDLFIADLTAPTPQTPQTAIYTAIFNPFQLDDGGLIVISEGIKTMLIQYIYFFILRDNLNIKTPTGTVNMQNENSTAAKFTGFNLEESYNDSIDNFDAIQWFINDNLTDYPDYNGQHLSYIGGA